jgi:uncharacterized protein YegL
MEIWMKRLGTLLGVALLVGACTGKTSVNQGACGEGETRVGGSCVPVDAGDGDPTDAGDFTDTQQDPDDDSSTPGDDTAEQDTGGPASDLPCEQWTDEDQDDLTCVYDNCPETKNPEQKDSDGDGVGDECDNCPNTANADQDPAACREPGPGSEDQDGETCREAYQNRNYYNPDCDSDGDGVVDLQDNCPEQQNPEQQDSDGDGVGDVCDNCPNVPNYDQTDTNDNGTGDSCEDTPPGADSGGDVCQNSDQVCGCKEQEAEARSPDVYIVLDRSGSMGNGNPSRMEQAKSALDTLADELGSTLHFGIMTYANNSTEELSMGKHTTREIKQSYAGVTDDGGTNTSDALKDVRENLRFRDPSTNNDEVVISITDGEPSNEGATVDEARKLHNDHGVQVYAIGFNGGDENHLEDVASAGGTGDDLSANNPQQLVATITDIALSCEYELTNVDDDKIDPDKIWVEANDDFRDIDRVNNADDENGYVYDSSSKTVTLTNDVCSDIQSEATDRDQITVNVVLGCPTPCQSQGEEECNFQDDDCDGQIDEGCEDCSTEICGNDEDDDCDDNVDEGCPDCGIQGTSCSSDGECCNQNCTSEGVCGPKCRPQGAACSKDSHCCSGTCTGGGGNRYGECVLG